jgi:hypothetical protein
MQNPPLQRLPLGRSTFSALRRDGCLYVDKTEYAYNLITQGYRYFLSRPRRFGKSLLVSTLQEILEGNKSLFENLWIEKSDYHWRIHGVIVLDFSALDTADSKTLNSGLCELLQKTANRYNLGITLNAESPNSALLTLIIALHAKFGHVAVLVDEYDSPIVKTLNNLEQATEIGAAIRSFFAALKSPDQYVDFIFITGVHSFARADIFCGGLNNLQIITLDERWATICGYTDQEIDHYFTPHIQGWANNKKIPHAEMRQKIKDWYNGYHFGKDVPAVYNPFSFMNAVNAQAFENYWLYTDTPAFLIEEMKQSHHDFEASSTALGTFEIGSTPLVASMFQAGYLTVTHYHEEKRTYLLDYPNQEVRNTIQRYIYPHRKPKEFDITYESKEVV